MGGGIILAEGDGDFGGGVEDFGGVGGFSGTAGTTGTGDVVDDGGEATCTGGVLGVISIKGAGGACM